MLASLKKGLKIIFPGVSWQNPVINGMFHVIDPIDYLVRKYKQLPHIPPYSVRVRSNGVTDQFGGQQFVRNGNLIADLLIDIGQIKPHDKILEIGCGCGRTAISLANYLDHAAYTGVDIEKQSLQSCETNKILKSKEFRFEELDVYNAEYNPLGKYRGDEYVFPFDDCSFNCVFLISVFTHMMPRDVENYIIEISRMLVNGGICVISTFLMDRGTKGQRISFPYHVDNYYTNNSEMPETAVGYILEYYIRIADQCSMTLMREPIYGTWIESVGMEENRFPQDIIILQKKN